jgi:cyclopropane-fatty-acyl-phospholipid synthase
MAACRVAFERNGIQLHQVLAVRPTNSGVAGMPLRPTW